jgi:hypothetical protein
MSPVTDVVPLSEANGASREAAATVPVVEGSPDRVGNRAGAGRNLHDAAVVAMTHRHAAGIACKALGRFRGNARAAFEDSLAGLIGICQHLGVDVDDDLIVLARGARIEPVVQCRLGQ